MLQKSGAWVRDVHRQSPHEDRHNNAVFLTPSGAMMVYIVPFIVIVALRLNSCCTTWLTDIRGPHGPCREPKNTFTHGFLPPYQPSPRFSSPLHVLQGLFELFLHISEFLDQFVFSAPVGH